MKPTRDIVRYVGNFRLNEGGHNPPVLLRLHAVTHCRLLKNKTLGDDRLALDCSGAYKLSL